MKSSTLVGATGLFGLPRKQAGWLQRLARSIVLKRLQRLQHGHLLIIEGDRRHGFGSAQAGDLQVTLQVNDPRFYGDLAFGGSIGAGERVGDRRRIRRRRRSSRRRRRRRRRRGERS